MTLEKQIVNVDFGRGVDNKRDETTVIPGDLLLLQNGQFDKVGAINKRLPFPILTDTATNPQGSIPSAVKLLPFKESINVITDRQQFTSNPNRPDAANETYYFDEQRDNYDRYEAAQSAVIQTFPIVGDMGDRGTYVIFDSFTKNNLTYHLVRYDRITALAQTYLIVTNSLDESISYSAVVDQNNTVPCARMALVGNILYIFYSSNLDTNLRYTSLNTNNLTSPTLSAPTILVNDLSATKFFDVCNDNTLNFIYIGYYSSTVNVTKLKRFNGGAITHSGQIADNATNGISIAYESTTGPSLLVAYANAANQVRFENFSSTLVSYAANVLISAEAVVPLSVTIHGTQTSYTTNGWPVMWSIGAAATIDGQTKIALISLSAVLKPAAIFCRSIFISSKIFFFNNNHYVFGFYYSELQSTFFLFHISGFTNPSAGQNYQYRVIGRYFAEQARIANNFQCPPAVAIIGNTVRYMSVLNKFFKPLSYFPRYGDVLYEVIAYLTDVRNFSSIEAANNSHIVGGLLSMFDGLVSPEHGFTHYPENPTLTQVAGGALTALGTYSYVVIFEWTDQFGQTHKSAPSAPQQIILAGANQQVQVRIPSYRITNKEDYTVTAKIFRTVSLGSNYQEVDKVYLTQTADSTLYVDILDDATLLTRAFLYTTGGVLENLAANPSWSVVNWKERVCLLTEQGVQFSKKRTDGNPIEFSDAFLIQIETIGGRGTALGVMDDKLIIFKKDRIYYVTGDGPNDTGTFGVFANPLRVESDVGCVNPKSVVNTDKGIIFQSAKGFHMLLRNLTVIPIGTNVEYFMQNTPVITSSVLIEKRKQVRFITQSGDCLVFDYLIEQWSVFTNHTGSKDLALYKNQVVRIDANSKVVIETEGVTYVDYNNTEYTLKIRTGWLSFANIQGFMRVYRFLLLGKFKSHHILTVKVAYDYNPKVVDTYSFNTNGAGKSLSVIPDGALYADVVFSGDDIYQVRGHLSKQKCEAVQLTIEDTSLSGTKESYALTNIAFEIGAKGAVFKKPAAFSNV